MCGFVFPGGFPNGVKSFQKGGIFLGALVFGAQVWVGFFGGWAPIPKGLFGGFFPPKGFWGFNWLVPGDALYTGRLVNFRGWNEVLKRLPAIFEDAYF